MDDKIDQARVYLNLAKDGKTYISRTTDASRALLLSAGSELTALQLEKIPFLTLEYVQVGVEEFRAWRLRQQLAPGECALRYGLPLDAVLSFGTYEVA